MVPSYAAPLQAANLDGTRALNRISDIESVLKRLGVFTFDQVKVRPRRDQPRNSVVASPLPMATTSTLSWNNDGCALLQDVTGSHRALLVRTSLDEGLLAPIDRDGLWLRYGLPMFEHLVGMDGALLAWECESHSGLHVVEENVVFELVQGELLLTSLTDLAQPTIQLRTGWSARIETEVCDCARPGRRLLDLHEVAPRKVLGRKQERMALAAHN